MRRATIYLEDELHRALKVKAFETNESTSKMANDAVLGALEEDLEDLMAIEARKRGKPVSYAAFLRELKSRCQI
jgi:predicted transcriptional regulator